MKPAVELFFKKKTSDVCRYGEHFPIFLLVPQKEGKIPEATTGREMKIPELLLANWPDNGAFHDCLCRPVNLQAPAWTRPRWPAHIGRLEAK